MFSILKTNLINGKIAQFYKFIKLEQTKDVTVFFNANGSFNLLKIMEYLWPNLPSDQVFQDLATYKYEDYLQCFKKLLPIFHHTNNILKNLIQNTPNDLRIHWMGNNTTEYLNMKSSYENDETSTLEHTLLLTSVLSNAITNVYLKKTKVKHVPHLLKDIINCTEIIDVFGFEVVILLKILMGSPNSINLRNIVWHGFPKPADIPSYFVDVLLITIHTMGCVIDQENIQLSNENQIISYNEHIQMYDQEYRSLTVNSTCIREKLQELDNDYKACWLQLLHYFETQRYKEFIMLALPQIELLLRLHYGTINNYDISAKLDEYYITIETIFKSYLPNEDERPETLNKLLDFRNSNLEGCFHLLFDLFLSPNGCRLRDKVSHGEVCLDALNNKELCSLVFHIFLVLMFPEQINMLENYESKLHLNSKTKTNLIKSYEKIKVFNSTHFENKQFLPLNCFRHDNKVLIFKRPKREAGLMIFINQIAENLYRTLVNYEKSLEIRCSLLAQRELHSKRRKTLENLKTALPDIFQTLCSILLCSFRIFELLQKNASAVIEDDVVYDKTLRFVKRCLTICENFLKYSHCESNEWIKSLALCRKYDEFHGKLYVCADCWQQ